MRSGRREGCRGVFGPIATCFAAAAVFDGTSGDKGRDGAFAGGAACLEGGTEERDATPGMIRDKPEDGIVYTLIYSPNRLKC